MMSMTIPQWVKPAIWGGIIGAVLITIVGFSTDTVVSGSTAQEMADNSAKQSTISAMAPICVAQFKTMTPNNQLEQLAALRDESSYKRDDFVIAKGWATMPGNAEPTDEIAAACAGLLMDLKVN